MSVAEEVLYITQAREMEIVMEVIRAIRNIRTEMNVPLDARVEGICFSKDRTLRDPLVKGEGYIKNLAKVKTLVVSEPPESGERPRDSVSSIIGIGDSTVEVFVPLKEHIDLELEAKRLERELAKLADEFEGVQKKLSNEEFVNRAPKEVVEKERTRLEAILEKKTRLESGLEKIRSMRR